MSKKSKQEEPVAPIVTDEPESETVVATDDVAPTSDNDIADNNVAVDADPPVKTATTKSGIAWLSLLLAVVALAAVGLVIFDQWRSTDSVEHDHSAIADLRADLSAKISTSQTALSDLDGKIAALSDSNRDLQTRLETQQRAIEQRNQLLDSLPVRMSGLENSVAALRGVSAGTRDTWLLAEAEYYMQIANAQLQLASNPHLAILALRMADERIVQLGNPALIEVRTAVSDELAALEVMVKPDIEGMTLTLSSLARVVDSLPLRTLEDTTADGTEGAESEDLSGVDRALASVKDAMSGLVKITPPNQAAAPLVTPDAVYFLRTNLTLQIQVARLALLRGETAIFEQSLDDASAWLNRYFDTGSAQVTSALQTIEEIRGEQFTAAAPDISNSLRLLRQYRMLTENAQ